MSRTVAHRVRPSGARRKNLLSRTLATLVLAVPLASTSLAAPVNQALPPSVAKALQANKIDSNALSVVMLPLPPPLQHCP